MDINNLFEEAVLNWRNNKGIGTAFIPYLLNNKVLVYQVLARVYTRSPTTTSIIIVNDFTERGKLIEFLTNNEQEDNNNEFKSLIYNKKIKIFTSSFIICGSWNSSVDLSIWYNPKEYNGAILNFINRCKFKLVILNKLFSKNTEITALYKVAPILECFKQSQIDELRISTPVEDSWVDITIPTESETWKLYEHYCKYIETTLNIFGSFDNIQEARLGNIALNISASEICTRIAYDNGWNDHLDMNYEYNRRIDEMYNPNALRERASQMYEYIRLRGSMLSDYEGKLEKVLEIVKANSGSKILIISKRGEFANKITEYLNNNSEFDICGNHHNKVDDIDAIDINGKPIYIKSGKSKGKRKVMGYKAQMTLNENRFNEDKINCLSLSNSPEKSLNVNVDVIIITSPLCEDIESYLYRLSNIRPINGKIKLFSIFCKNTIEQQRLFNKSVKQTHIIVNKSEFTDNAEKNTDFLIVD